MKNGFHTIWDVKCYDKNGNLKWEELDIHNLLHDEGEEWMLQVCFPKTATVPGSFYIGIDNRSTIAEGDSMPVTGEPSGNGYARQPVNSDNTDWIITQDAGDYQVKSKLVRFTASGGNIPAAGDVLNMFLATTLNDSGVLIGSVALSTNRRVLDGDSMDISVIIKLGE